MKLISRFVNILVGGTKTIMHIYVTSSTICIDHNFQYFEFNTADIPDPSKTVRCPKCGSTSVTTQERGYNLMWGMLGSTKKKNLCQRCGYTWWPGAGK